MVVYGTGKTFRKIKSAFIKGINWYDPEYRTIITCCTEDIKGLQKTLDCFSKYLLNAYNTLFIETELGVGHITCINEQGIRIQYFDSSYDYEWINLDYKTDLDASIRKLVEQE